MSLSYLISPSENIDWRVDKDDFIKKLYLKWLNVQVYPGPDPSGNFMFSWTQGTLDNGDHLNGMMYSNQLSVCLEGNFKTATEFALWYRGLVPQQYKLLFMDQGFIRNIELDKNTTEQQIVEAFA